MAKNKSTYVCPHHNRTVKYGVECPDCLQYFKNLPDAELMTGDERAAEFARLRGVMTVSFDKLHSWLEKLVGRGVFTHEFAYNMDGLIEECRTRRHPETIEDTIPESERDKWMMFDMRSPEGNISAN